MLNKAEPDIRIILPFIAVIVITLVGGMFLTKVSIGIAFAAVGAIILALICFMNPELGLYILICAMLLGPQFGTGGAAGEGVRGRGLTLRLDDFLLLIIGFSWFLSTAINKERGLFLKTPLNRYIALLFHCLSCCHPYRIHDGTREGDGGDFFRPQILRILYCLFYGCELPERKKADGTPGLDDADRLPDCLRYLPFIRSPPVSVFRRLSKVKSASRIPWAVIWCSYFLLF